MEPGEGPRGGAGPSGAPDDAEDDCCVYTYRGGAPAEARPPPPGRRPRPPRAPRHPQQPQQPQQPRSGASSPDADYLEMDFDPPCETDAGDDSAAADDGDPDADADEDGMEPGPSNDPGPPEPSEESEPPADEPCPPSPIPPRPPLDRKPRNGGPPSSLTAHTTVRGDAIYVRRTVATWPAREGEGHRGGGGDLVSPGDAYEVNSDDRPERATMLEESRLNLSSALFHSTMAKRLVVDNHEAKFLQERDDSNTDGDDRRGSGERPASFEPVPKCMVWTELEACSRQITQIGTSACGATAVINALAALGRFDAERARSAVNTRQRANDGSLCRYIISRSIAGCGVDALAAGLSIATDGAVSSRHFALWPERKMSLSHWLAYWIASGGVPIATLNLQAGLTDPARTPDSWHHQMIFGVGPRGVYMTNPLECVEEGLLWHQLCSDPVLLIKRKDILGRWTRDTNLRPLLNVPGDERWTTMNVLGQVVNMIRESQQCTNDLTRTTHIKIPACYSAGITVAVLTGSDAHRKLISAPELPLLYSEEE